MEPRRLLNVSNRLPITVRLDADRLEFAPSCGGLAVGLRGRHDQKRDLWFGWPGMPMEAIASKQREIDERCAGLGLVPVSLTTQEVTGHYEGFANGVLWPLFHYSLDRIPLEHSEWNSYRDVNERFAEAVARQYRDGDLIWIHDYHLMLAPAILRRYLPNARIGFFLHIPFPAYEVLRTLPWRLQILSGILGADLIGFHTPSYVGCLEDALRRELNLDIVDHRVRVRQRHVQIGTFPMGPDVDRFRTFARSESTRLDAASIRADAGRRTIFLGVDRLDYTKGIPRRLLAFERLLADDPSLRDRVRLIQVTVPSRTSVVQYQDFRHQIEEIVGRINGTVGTISSAPVHYLYQMLEPAGLAALYAACDVMLVTPLRDGMNLVAKEFVVCRPDEDGVLVLSEFAGAAEELREAIIVNPYDVDALTASMRQALLLGRDERRARMRALRSRVIGHGAHEWAESFLAALAAPNGAKAA